jgi:pyruvate dehydrogenase E2 component (dihydrolipoamide acetyltransferase)
MIEFQMPSLGADMEDGTLVEWRKKPGDAVKRGDIIADIETQKGLIEIEVFDEGVIEKLLIKEGAKVPVGTVLALINPTGEVVESKEESLEEREIAKVVKEEPLAEVLPERVKISPLARKMAIANNIEVNQIRGTGPDGAITKQDVENFIARSKELPVEKPEATGKERSRAASENIRRAIAAAMSKSNREIPHYYLEKKVSLRNAISWMQETNKRRSPRERLLPVALMIKAVARALRDVPALNAIWDNGLHLKTEVNIGLVVALRMGGVVVPCIPNADLKTVDEIMSALNDMIPRAKALNLRSSELSDSTITVTNLGEDSADKVFGIIYPPQVAIIGFGEISQQPFAENGMLGICPVICVTLAGDHRATDGLTGSRFLAALDKYLQNPEQL